MEPAREVNVDSADLRARFNVVFEREFAYVWTSLRRLGVHTRDLEDLCHDLFVEVHRRFATYDPARPIKPWLFAFAFRFASDYRRLARHREGLDPDFDAPSGGPSAEAELMQAQRERMVHAAIAKITEERRGVFVLYELDEVPMGEIASSMNIPVNTAYSRLRLARDEFREAVARLKRNEDRS